MPSGDRKTFRKFFKFQVSKPIEVKTKCVNLKVRAAKGDRIFFPRALLSPRRDRHFLA